MKTEVLPYLRSIGVSADNFDFYIGTHPHSDHIALADEIIYEFRPARDLYSLLRRRIS